MTIPCVHEGKKRIMNILYFGHSQKLAACIDCENIIKSSSLCEVIS